MDDSTGSSDTKTYFRSITEYRRRNETPEETLLREKSAKDRFFDQVARNEQKYGDGNAPSERPVQLETHANGDYKALTKREKIKYRYRKLEKSHLDPADRECLSCSKKFASLSKLHRLCSECKTGDEFKYGESYSCGV